LLVNFEEKLLPRVTKFLGSNVDFSMERIQKPRLVNLVFWKRLAIGALVVCLVTGMLWFSLWNQYVSTRPREMQRASGRIVPLSSHGIVVYLTEDERNRLRFLYYAGDVFGLSFVLIYLLKRPFRNPN